MSSLAIIVARGSSKRIPMKNIAKIGNYSLVYWVSRAALKSNFDDVGDNFPYEARSLHYRDKKNKKGIYGNASSKEIKELNEEGIETTVIPWIKENEN